MLVIPYPAIDPILVSVGPLAIRWYALAYIVGLLLGWRYCLWIASQAPKVATRLQVDDFLVWATLGVILGGRTGYVLFYRPEFYFNNPTEIVQLWHGGMSFHGGALGVLTALWFFTRQRKIGFLAFADIIACAVPIGLFFGRLANFINGELWGRTTDVPWAMQFPSELLSANKEEVDAAIQAVAKVAPGVQSLTPAQAVGDIVNAWHSDPQIRDALASVLLTRHPSQLYEAFLEGIVLFVVMFGLMRWGKARFHPGTLTGIFLVGYGLARIISEFFRQPDANLGFLFAGATMGQLLSLPLVLLGLGVVWYARRRPALT